MCYAFLGKTYLDKSTPGAIVCLVFASVWCDILEIVCKEALSGLASRRMVAPSETGLDIAKRFCVSGATPSITVRLWNVSFVGFLWNLANVTADTPQRGAKIARLQGAYDERKNEFNQADASRCSGLALMLTSVGTLYGFLDGRQCGTLLRSFKESGFPSHHKLQVYGTTS